ncbi:alpha/beta fold hydrolase BchO [Thermaurantiacus tibetensis]|uniref:alpha/beta fold hydrolase BchO n=1 Tax=Thermaurantiacus tibetensis TaxID=2759035 RepID=UPI00188F1E62|nr:alpha/beta fold hydrolase BchO [Thermaurantiacus tibetensis]
MSAPDWNRDGADWPNREASRFVEAAGIPWHVQVMGEGPPLLLLHGTGAATHSWRDLLPILARDFQVVAPDLPGHGFTAPLRELATIPNMARAVEALLERLGIVPRLMAAHSAGAAIAARMLIDRPGETAGLVSFNGALRPFPGLARELFPGLAKALFLNPLTPRLFALQAGLMGAPERFLARATGSRVDARGAELYGRLFAKPRHVAGALEMMANWDLDALDRDLPRLAIPVMLVAGSNDLAIPPATAREVAARIPEGEVRILTGLGHLAHEEKPHLAAELVREAARATGAAPQETVT